MNTMPRVLGAAHRLARSRLSMSMSLLGLLLGRAARSACGTFTLRRLVLRPSAAEHVCILPRSSADLLDPRLAAEAPGHQRRCCSSATLDLDLAVVELARRAACARSFSRVASARRRRSASRRRAIGARPPRRAGRGSKQIEQPLLGGVLARARAHLRLLLVLHQLDRDLDQVAHDRLDVAADVADLGELRRLDLEERRLRELAPGGARSRSSRRRSARS